MRLVKKFLLTVLAALPVASISTAADSKLTEMTGEEQNDALNKYDPSEARCLIMEPGTAMTTVDEAKNRLSRKTGITDERMLDTELRKQIQILRKHRLIEMDEANIIASVPSAW